MRDQDTTSKPRVDGLEQVGKRPLSALELVDKVYAEEFALFKGRMIAWDREVEECKSEGVKNQTQEFVLELKELYKAHMKIVVGERVAHILIDDRASFFGDERR
jgi:hypothetical protein